MVALEDSEIHESRAFTIIPLITRALCSKAEMLKNTLLVVKKK